MDSNYFVTYYQYPQNKQLHHKECIVLLNFYCVENISPNSCSRVKTNCPIEGPRALWGVTSVGVFLGILTLIYMSFGENRRKLLTTMLTNTTVDWTWHFPSIRFEYRTSLPLEGSANIIKLHWGDSSNIAHVFDCKHM